LEGEIVVIQQFDGPEVSPSTSNIYQQHHAPEHDGTPQQRTGSDKSSGFGCDDEGSDSDEGHGSDYLEESDGGISSVWSDEQALLDFREMYDGADFDSEYED
jgi:hypothetical protein